MSSEYFKIFDTHQIVGEDTFAIRIKKSILKPIISDSGILHFTIGDKVTIRRVVEDKIRTLLTIPLEKDFNSELIRDYVVKGRDGDEVYDMTVLSSLKEVVRFCPTGLQFRDSLAYVHNGSFIVYKPVDHPVDFIMTQSNASELVRFVKAHNKVFMYEVGAYAVMRSGSYYLGCRLPARFVDSEYAEYLAAKPEQVVEVDLSELRRVIKDLPIPKGMKPLCRFDFSTGYAYIEADQYHSYTVALDSQMQLDCRCVLAVELLKQMFISSTLPYCKTTMQIYTSFVAFKVAGVDMLLGREV